MISKILMSCLSEAGVRSFLRMTLGFDHRVLDGAMGARFLAHRGMMLGFRSGPDERRAGAWCAGGSST